MNRVISSNTQATSGWDCWGQTVPSAPSNGYDRYGNLSIINVSQCWAPSLNLGIDTNTNRINTGGYTYDAAGNLTNDPNYSYNYVWNGAGLLQSAGGVTYTYDGNGNRVKKSSGALYWRGLGGSVLAETNTSGNTLDEYVYFDGDRIARRDASGNVYYYFPDALGSEVSITNATGIPCYDADFYLFGGEKVFTNTCEPAYKFAGMERDSETGLDHTLYRQYSSQYGRWLSPDPMGGDVTNPQSLNRYAYVTNNPTTFTDPLGLVNLPPGSGEGGGGSPNECDPFMDPFCNPCGEFTPCLPILPPPIHLPAGNGSGSASGAPPAGQPPLAGGCNGDPTGCGGGGTDLWPLLAGVGGAGSLAAFLSQLGEMPAQAVPATPGSAGITACTPTIVNAVDKIFHGNFISAYGVWNPGYGLPGAAVNLFMFASPEMGAVSLGRYPLNWFSYVIGYGPTLHITGPGQYDPSAIWDPSSGEFTAHLDSAYAYNPIGLLLHWLIDMLGIGRNPCP